MPVTIYAIDTEFAASTGSNVNAGSIPNTSYFDYPPNGTMDLVITSNTGDPDPNSFEVGDSYDLVWGGSGGGGSIEDATIIRSDDFPSGGSVVVFEGIDDQGDLTQIVWTPDFDLEGWYWDNYTPSDDPAFYVTDQDSGSYYQHVCFCAEMRIATPAGPRRAGALEVGDLVRTEDHGFQPVRWVSRSPAPQTGAEAPIRIGPDVLGNIAPLMLSPQHRVLLSGPKLERITGHASVLVPAKALAGRRGVARAPRAASAYVNILLDHHDIVFAEGAACETLFLGREARRALIAGSSADRAALTRLPEEMRHVWGADTDAARPMLRFRAARKLLRRLGDAPLVDEAELRLRARA